MEANLPKSKKSNAHPLGVVRIIASHYVFVIFVVGKIEPLLATAIQENLSIPCRSDETVKEVIRGIRAHFTKYVKPLGGGLLEQAQLGLGHSYSRSKVILKICILIFCFYG